jgi:NAD(P)-dependent dehydrogenase (short-subunit alcohol dehydrogenase family)
VVLNAGALVNKPFRDLSAEDFHLMATVNWSAQALLVQDLLPLLAPGAHVVFISSMGGFQGASKYPGLLAYATSKMAMAGLAESLQAELGPEGFFFNTLCLGAVQTEMLAEAFPDYQASTSPKMMGLAVANFALNGHQTQAGQVIPMTKSNP